MFKKKKIGLENGFLTKILDISSLHIFVPISRLLGGSQKFPAC